MNKGRFLYERWVVFVKMNAGHLVVLKETVLKPISSQTTMSVASGMLTNISHYWLVHLCQVSMQTCVFWALNLSYTDPFDLSHFQLCPFWPVDSELSINLGAHLPLLIPPVITHIGQSPASLEDRQMGLCLIPGWTLTYDSSVSLNEVIMPIHVLSLVCTQFNKI